MVIKKKKFSEDIKPGEKIIEVFCICDKRVQNDKKGKQYCKVSLGDRKGRVEGVLWPDCFESACGFEDGDFVNIEGLVSEYQGKTQVTIKKIDIVDDADIDISDFIYTRFKPEELDNMLQDLLRLIKGIENSQLKKLLGSFFKDQDFLKSFINSTAALQYHHAYSGGLLEHTLSVATISRFLASHYKNLDEDLVVAGAILHDIGKTIEYNTGSSFSLSDSGKLLGHITLGYEMVLEKILEINGFDPLLKDSLLHIIISHHGFEEYGSPKAPRMLEAFIVFHADYLDADIGGFDMLVKKSSVPKGWSNYSKQFNRSVLLNGKKQKSSSKKKSDSEEGIPKNSKNIIEKALDDKSSKSQDGLF